MKYTISFTSAFKKDYKHLIRQNADMSQFDKAVDILIEDGILPFVPYKTHSLKNRWKGHIDSHIAPDWVLIYQTDDKNKIVKLVRMGSHSLLFS